MPTDRSKESYGNLKSLSREIRNRHDEERKLEQEIEKMRADLENLEEQRKPIEQDLELFSRLQSHGLNYENLEKIMLASEVFSDLERILDAINTYKTREEMKTELSSLQYRSLATISGKDRSIRPKLIQ